MKKIILLSASVLLSISLARPSRATVPAPSRPAYFALKVYHFKTARQEALIDSFLQRQYLPVLHAAGIPAV
ncbi:MAG: NIPSNAP family containing protein, partial [Hymenobacter sp.]